MVNNNIKIKKILLYLGRTRPIGRDDYGIILLEKIEKKGYDIIGIILSEDDPINLYPEIKFRTRYFLLEELKLPKKMIIEKLNQEEFKLKFNSWLDEIKKSEPELGISFYAYWIPPELYKIPKNGFINYHPGPLPYLKGMEPDTFAILEGWKKIWGTTHRIDMEFDQGEILTITKKYKISKYSTPIQILYNLTMLGVDSIVKAIKLIEKKEKIAAKSIFGTNASRKKAKESSYLDFSFDKNINIERKLRAFCGQDIGIRYKVRFNDKEYIIFDLETFKSKKYSNIKSGQFLGNYIGKGRFYNQPIFKTLDGFCVLLIDETCEKFFREWIIPPRKRKKRTSLKIILDSIKNYLNSSK